MCDAVGEANGFGTVSLDPFLAGVSSASVFVDHSIVGIDPDAEFAPGLRYADYFTIEISSGVVNPMPEPGAALTAEAALVVLVRLRRMRRHD